MRVEKGLLCHINHYTMEEGSERRRNGKVERREGLRGGTGRREGEKKEWQDREEG